MGNIIILCFYKADSKNADWTDRLISKWTNGKYSHVEVLLPNDGDCYELEHDLTMVSSSGRNGGVRLANHVINNDAWDYFSINIRNQAKVIYSLYRVTKHCKYDWSGIAFSQVIPLGIDKENRFFCSEYVTIILKLVGVDNIKLYLKPPNKISPNLLFRILENDLHMIEL